jgi:hypothetical protein
VSRTRLLRIAPLLVSAGLVAAPAAGQGAPECECRAFGRTFRVGEALCLDGALRICGMSGNVTSWLITGRSCPEA